MLSTFITATNGGDLVLALREDRPKQSAFVTARGREIARIKYIGAKFPQVGLIASCKKRGLSRIYGYILATMETKIGQTV